MKNFFYLFLSLTFLFSCKSDPLNLKVMSFNIRFDNPSDSLNAWQYRKDVATQTIKDQNVDILGMQEVLKDQLKDLKERLPDYNSIGVGREDGKEAGEYSPLLYRKDKFSEQNSGYFWLSETPEKIGVKGWDAACERIATWAVLKDIKTGKEFFVINTHFDHVGEVARRESVALILNRANEYSKGLPIIAIGDFNATPQSEVILAITNNENPKHLIHTKDIAQEKSGLEWTFHAFGRVPLEKREFIDYIFVSKNVQVKKHMTLPEKLDDIYISDHLPVVVDLIIP